MGQSSQGKNYHRPHVILKAAMTLDGKIATRSGDSRISSKRDLKRLHMMRAHADAVMIGIGTQRKDDPLLTVRHTAGRNPIRIVVDSLARTPPNSRILSLRDAPTIIAVSSRAPTERVSKLERSGARIIHCGSKKVDLRKLLAKLYTNGVKRVLLEGGGKLNWSMLRSGLVDDVSVTIAPYIVGGQKATTLVEGLGRGRMREAIKLSMKSIERSGKEVVLNYEVRR